MVKIYTLGVVSILGFIFLFDCFNVKTKSLYQRSNSVNKHVILHIEKHKAVIMK